MKFHQILVLISALALFSFFIPKDNKELFPNRDVVLSEHSSKYDNFFPIATIDLKAKGIKDRIHIVYVSFDPSVDDSTLFPKPDYIDAFTFDITNEGKLKPAFSDKALTISSSFSKYFLKAKGQYAKAKKEIKRTEEIIEFTDEPQWLQYDQTPVNAKGQPYKFICELDVQDIVDDDCKMYVFYDEGDKKIKCVYQRT